MKTFTIENETNNIALHGSAKEAEAVPNSERFGNEAALAKLAADWPAVRLVAIWNSLQGAAPVTKFKDRATGVSRIWKAIQSLGQAADEPVSVAEATPVAELPGSAPDNAKDADKKVKPEALAAESLEPAVATPVAQQAPDVAPEAVATREKKAPKTATEPGAPREGSKTSQVIAMLKREGGSTLEEIMTAMDWQKHTTRSMLSAGGSLMKKHGLVVTSEKVGEKRVYSIKG